MTSALELKVIFAAVDRFVRPVNNITNSASAAAKALRENTARLKELDKTVANIDAFKKAEKEAAITANTFHKNQRALDELKAAITRVGVPTKTMAAELERLGKRSDELRNKHQTLTDTEQRLFEKLKAAKVDTSNLAEARRQLAGASAHATNESHRLSTALDAENQKMRRLRAAQANFAKAKETAGKVAMAGAGITAAGAAVALPVGKAVSDFAAFETAMLGVARQMEGARDINGKVTKTYWEMADAIKAMSERLPGTSADIAKIVEGGARMGIQGKENLLIYAETTAVMAKAFDLPVDQVGEDIGKISQLYKVPIKDIKQLGDTINWLDDQALAKGGDIIDVMKRIAGTADMANMSFRDAAALGSTFLSLGANAEVAASASNAMIRELAVADMQSKRFKEGMSMLGLQGKAIQIGMSKDATGTIITVLEKIKSLSADKQLEAATRIFGKEFGDDAAKLASNLDEYRRQLQLTKDQAAFGSMQREADAWADTLDARIGNAKDAFANLSSDLGKHLKPAIASSLETTLGMVQAVRNWAAEHPALAGGLMTAAKGLAIVLAVLGAVTIGAGAILVPLAMLKFSMVTLGITGSGAIGMIGTAFATVGRLMLLNPIGLAITGLIAAAALIYTYWTPIKGFFSSLWAGISATGRLAVDGIKGWFSSLPDYFRTIGVAITTGLWSSLSSGWSALIAKVEGLAQLLPDAVKRVLGIRSPSRVFAELGMHTMAGLEQGIAKNSEGPAAALKRATAALVSGAGIAVTAPAIALPQTDPPAAIRKIVDASEAQPESQSTTLKRLIADVHQAISLPDPPPAIRKIIDQQIDQSGRIENRETVKATEIRSRRQPAPAYIGNTYQITISLPAGTASSTRRGSSTISRSVAAESMS